MLKEQDFKQEFQALENQLNGICVKSKEEKEEEITEELRKINNYLIEEQNKDWAKKHSKISFKEFESLQL